MCRTSPPRTVDAGRCGYTTVSVVQRLHARVRCFVCPNCKTDIRCLLRNVCFQFESNKTYSAFLHLHIKSLLTDTARRGVDAVQLNVAFNPGGDIYVEQFERRG